VAQTKRPKPPFPKQKQSPPGDESEMQPKPVAVRSSHTGTGKLRDKVAIVTGGDSGIGRAVCVLFAQEGAKIVLPYLNEHDDAAETVRLVEEQGSQALALAGDLGSQLFINEVVKRTMQEFGGIDILVNNAAEQHPQKSLTDITLEQLQRTFQTNILSYFLLTQAVLPHLKEKSCIINTSSVTAYRGSPSLLDYSSTKGAVVSFTRSLALSLAPQKIRVNCVAPGPVWTPLIVSTFESEKSSKFGENTPMGRPGQPAEIAPCYLFLASSDSSYMTGQILHPNGGEIING
jgi:NAD(P)-dependent dehydrogenase (short-subunit alcohol dehydrogenase family)